MSENKKISIDEYIYLDAEIFSLSMEIMDLKKLLTTFENMEDTKSEKKENILCKLESHYVIMTEKVTELIELKTEILHYLHNNCDKETVLICKMRLVNRLTFTQISNKLGYVSESTARKKYNKAIKTLNKENIIGKNDDISKNNLDNLN